MAFLLDTDTCIYVMNSRPPKALERFRQCAVGSISVSEITVSELEFGIANSKNREENRCRLNEFLHPLQVLSYRSPASRFYGELRSRLKNDGQLIGSMDMLIAAQALAENLTLVTNNTKEFTRVPGLRTENWLD